MARLKKKIYKKEVKNHKSKKIKNINPSKSINKKKRNGKSTSSKSRKKSLKIKRLFSDNSDQIFDGIKIVMTGVFRNFSERSQFGDILKNLGARVNSAVSGVTDVLIHGYILEDGREVFESRKYKLAQEKATLIYSEENFLEEYKKKNWEIVTFR